MEDHMGVGSDDNRSASLSVAGKTTLRKSARLGFAWSGAEDHILGIGSDDYGSEPLDPVRIPHSGKRL